MISRLERTYLPDAAYVSATSVPMAEYLTTTYDLHTMRVWHNCFPSADAASLRGPADRPARTGVVELAWISATIGPRRGLEDLFAALPRMASRVAVHLYGAVAEGKDGWLDRQLAPVRERTEVVMHSVRPANTILPALATHQVGLSLDGDDSLNCRRPSATSSFCICRRVWRASRPTRRDIAPSSRPRRGTDAPIRRATLRRSRVHWTR